MGLDHSFSWYTQTLVPFLGHPLNQQTQIANKLKRTTPKTALFFTVRDKTRGLPRLPELGCFGGVRLHVFEFVRLAERKHPIERTYLESP